MAWNISGNTNYANIHKNSGILTYGTELCGGVPSGCTPSVDYSVSCYLEEGENNNFPDYTGDFYDGNIVRKNYNGKSCNQDMFVMWFNFPDNLSYDNILDSATTADGTSLFDIKNVDDCEHVVISSDGLFRTGGQKFEYNSYTDSGYPKIASNPCGSEDISVKYVSGTTYQGHKIKYHTISNEIPNNFYTNHAELVELYFPHMYDKNSDEGKNIEVIGESAFTMCGRLSAVTFGAVEEIKANAFLGCNLQRIDWGHAACNYDSKVREIGDYAFKNIICDIDLCLDKLKSINTIGKGAFSNDDDNNLPKTLILPTATSYSAVSDNCFDNSHVDLLIDDDKKEPYRQIPNNIKKIGNRAFYGHTSTSITIPNNVNEIGDKAFEANSINKRILNEYCRGYLSKVSTSFDLTSWTEENFEKAEIGAYALGDTTTISEIKIKNGTRNAFLSKFGSYYSDYVVEVEEA